MPLATQQRPSLPPSLAATITPLTLARRLDPSYRRPPHLALLDDLLLDVAARKITRLLVTMPPRHAKSETCSHWFPAWLLGHRPDTRVILASYEASFAASWGRKVRDSLAQAAASGLFATQVRDDVSAAGNWAIAGHDGGMRTAGVGGAITGFGADVLIVDDPVKNAEEATSLVYREKAWEWWRSTAFSRLEPGGVAILIQTRWHQDDLAGRILAQEADKWHTVNLPALAEEGDLLGRAPGVPLWPERYPAETLADIREVNGSYWWAALYQQAPTIRGESMFRADLIRVLERPVPRERIKARVRAWDLAGTEGGGDWTVGVRMALLDDESVLVEDVQRFQRSPQQTRAAVAQTAAIDGPEVPILMEQEPGQSGKDQIDSYRRTVVPGYRLTAVRATTNKTLRADPFAAAVEAGRVAVYRADWTLTFLAEMEAFPHGAHDDQVDASAVAFGALDAKTARHVRAGGIIRGAAPAPRAYGGQ